MARALTMGVVAAAAVLVFLCATAVPAAAQGKKGLPKNSHVIHPKQFGRREQVLSCDDTADGNTPCVATCDKRCPNECVVLCPGCKTYCICDFYPGVSCGDPRFTGADGNNFYFHGKKDQDFCVVSDTDLHINAHFIGKRNPTMSRDFTWIQALGIRFADHRLYMGAQKTVKWDSNVDHLELAFDDMPIEIPTAIDAQWQSTTKDSRIHNYGVTEDDSLAHFDIGFKFHSLTNNVHGVLGQTYRTDYVNKLSVSANMPIMGGTSSYVTSDIFSTDCKVTRFGRSSGISMVTGMAT
ncbi:unnamed protein product [Triticum turgidum subsp. durum]|uniref:Uncharacterized protein n=1 Tax=Triticum turgidum subsp. durum TaxID=4567 RepID=A0A9R1R1D7_TRITD|nr:unnamed protein product [Triticum turgidum subsp. durum]